MQDLRLAFRALSATPLVSTAAVLSLALGIGANTAIFSVADGLLLRPLPVSEPAKLVTVTSEMALGRGYTAGAGWTYAMWTRLRDRVASFDGAFAMRGQRLDLAERGESQPVDGVYVSGDYFRTLGVRALAGRTFTLQDDVRGGGPDGPVVVISYTLWQRRFGGAAKIIGAPLSINGTPFTVVGVTPPAFTGVEVGRTFDLLLPLNTEPLVAGKASVIDNPRVIVLIVMLRLKAEQSIEAATETIRAMQPDILGEGAPAFLSSPFQLVSAEGGTSGAMGLGGLRQQYERPILTLLVGVMFVLVVACLNIANLLLARTTIRNHELSVRVALGAPRWRLARQWLVESLVTAGLGSALGLLFALWGSRVLVSQLSTSLSQVALNLSLDWRVLGFTAAITIATALLFGSMPAFRAARVSPIDALRGQGTQSPRRRILSLSSGLVVTQVAVSLVLVVAAGLFGRTFGRLAGELKGFDSNRALVMKVDTARTRVDQASRNRFFHRLVAAAAAVPGVADASASIYVPGGRAAGLIFDARGRSTNVGPGRRVVANFVTPRWFSTYGIALRSGRDIGDLDSANGPPVMVVNEAFVHAFLSGRDPIGGSLIDADLPFLKGRTVVGVVGDVVYGSPRDAAPPTIYLPLAQSESSWPAGQTAITIGISPLAGSPASLAPGVAAALSAADRDLAFSFTSLTDQLNDSLSQERLMATLSAFFGVLALLLAGLGLYGITAYAVSRRRTEIAIRLALGMPPQSVVTMVIARVATVIGLGLAVGTVASLWLSGFVSSLLYGVEPRDLATLAVAGAVLAAVGMAAGWLPAHRAKRTNPAVLLRSN